MDENSTILTTLLEIKQDIGHIKATLEGSKKETDELEVRTNQLSNRVFVIENQQARWKWTLAGASAVLFGLFKAIEVWWSHAGNHQ